MDQRREFVLEAMRKDRPFRQLCEQYGISAKTGYKWCERFEKGGLPGLQNLSRRPQSSPSRLEEDVVCRIIKLKEAHRTWGPRKIRAVYERVFPAEEAPSESSFKRVLEKAGFVEKRRSKRPASESGRLQQRRNPTAPNELWTVDFKGWWLASDGRRCEPLTIRDGYSRYILCADPLDHSGTEAVRSRFEQAFQEYGLPQMIRSDNGTPFASAKAPFGLSKLSAWWLVLGIGLDRIDPGRPDQNGAHERMHRDIALEVEGVMRGTLAEQQAALAVWRESYNCERPHEALKNRVPKELYRPSERQYHGTPERLSYPEGFAERTVKRSGDIRLGKEYYFLSTTLAGWNVGLREEEGGKVIGVWFGGLRIGTIDREAAAFRAGKEAVEMPP